MSKSKAYKPENEPGWWRDVCGYGGKYQVSRHGEVRRVNSTGLVHDMTAYTKSGRQFRGRLFVKLTKGGKSKEEPLLQIVAAAWLGQTPAGKVPYHMNGIVTDNRSDNIGFITRSELGKRTGAMADARAIVFMVDRDGEVVEVYRSAREAAKANFMSYQSVLDRCHNRIKNHYALNGYTFQFEEKPKKRRKKTP